MGEASPEAVQLAEARGSAIDRGAARIADRLALVAGATREDVLIDRQRRLARIQAAPLPGATLLAYQQLEARAAAGENGWTILLVPPAAAFPDMPALTDPATPETEAALATVIWAWRRLRTPIGVAGAEADAVVERLRAAGVDARVTGSEAGQVRFAWLAPGN